MYESLIRPLPFNLDAQRVHQRVFENLCRATRVTGTPALLRALYDFQHLSLTWNVF